VTPSTADRVAPLLQQRIKAVFRRLPKALAGGEEDLHQMRVAGRRLRVALPLLVRKAEGKRARRSLRLLRGLTRTGGISRDLDVSVALFEAELAKSPPSPEDRILRRRLRAARTRGHARMAEALLDLEIARLRRDLRVLARRGDGVFAVLRRIRELRDGHGTETLALIAALGKRFDPTSLHRLRRQVRRLRYAAELSGALKGQAAAAATDFRALQDELGALHDTYVLSEWFRRQAESCRMRGDTAVAKAAAARHEGFLEASRAHHQAFLALPPAEVVARALAAMGQSRPAA
jgi:CHAD domain-containing protein